MTEQLTNTPLGSSSRSPRFLPLLLVLFFGSGCAALIYEIVWFQLLQQVIGPSAVSLGVLLGSYLGGMCLGNLILPRFIPARRHPLGVYAALELGTGLLGILILYGMPLVGRVFLDHVGHGFAANRMRGVVGAVWLLPPTLLMGATLSVVARWVETTPKGVSWLGFFYGANIAGAMFGCLLAGFNLLRVHDTATATFTAAMINGAVALSGFGLTMVTLQHPPEVEATPIRAERSPGSWAVYVSLALSGLCALGAEVVWTRLLSLLLGGIVYTFTIVLAVFLVGLGIGSCAGSFLARETLRPRVALGVCQMLLAAAIAWAALVLAESLPYWPIDSSLSRSPWFNFQLDLVRCLWAILPATLLCGASLPLALAAVASRGQDPAPLAGGVYAANTVGAIIGALGFSTVLIPWLGAKNCERLLIGLAALSALVVFGSLFSAASRAPSTTVYPQRAVLRIGDAIALFFAVTVVASWLAWRITPGPPITGL